MGCLVLKALMRVSTLSEELWPVRFEMRSTLILRPLESKM